MKLNIIFLIIALLLLAACDKPNPHPETMDPIYAEIEREAAAAENSAKAAEKELEGFEKDREAVVPQTGQIKYADKRVSETKARIAKLRQMVQYWKIRAESRKEWAMKSYMAAYKAKKPWPDPKEYDEYKQLRKFEQASKQWNIQERLEQSKAGISIGPGKGGEHGGGGEPEAPAEHH